MKFVKNLIIVSATLIGLLGGYTGAEALDRKAEKTAVKSGIECIAEEGRNPLGQHYVIPGVIDENGQCVELQGTAPKVIHDKATYGLLKGRAVETKTEEGYTIRIADQDKDGKVDNYDLIDPAGNIVLGYFKDIKTGKVYSKCTLPGRVIDGIDAKLEDSTVLDQYNDILKNPKKHGYKDISNDLALQPPKDAIDELLERIAADPELIKKYEGLRKNFEQN